MRPGTNANAAPDALVFPTSSGSRRDNDNARERVIRPVVAHADVLLAQRGREPLPAGVTAHKLRHTFASILFVRGEDPPYVMAQLGHTDPAFTLRVYPCDTPRRGRQGGPEGARRGPPLGTNGHPRADDPRSRCKRSTPRTTKAPRLQGFRKMGAAGFEPATSRV